MTPHKAAATSEEIGSKTFKSWRLNKPRLFYHSVLAVCQEFQRRSIADSPHGRGGGLGRGLGVVWCLGVGVGLGVGVALPEAVAVAVAVGVGVGVDGW